MSKLEVLRPATAPAPIGPYSPMIRVGDMIWGSALAGVEPKSGDLAGDTAYEQAAQALKLVVEMLEEVGSGLSQVVSTTIFLKDVADFAEMNRAYVEAFGIHEPTRSVVSVVDLPKPGALLTMNFVAVTKA
jgi:2-iminobutanoate/2-iminopropanoate deaminase